MQTVTRRVVLAGMASLAYGAVPTIALPKKVRLGLIGLEGHVGDVLGPLPSLPDVTVTAIASTDEAAVARHRKGPSVANARVYKTYPDMLAKEELDVVAVVNDNGARAAAILACVERGIAVMAEKPLALTRQDLQRIRTTVEARRVPMGMLLPMRYSGPYLAMRQVVESGEVGEIAQIDAQKSYKYDNQPGWKTKRASYGGTLAWIGIHMIDLMRWTSGREYREVAAREGHVAFPEVGDLENVTAALYTLDNGGVATLRMDYLRPGTASSHGDDRLRLAGTKGVVEYMAATGVTVLTAAKKARVVQTLPADRSVFAEFLESVYLGKTPSLPMADIWRVSEVTLATQEAARAGFAAKPA